MRLIENKNGETKDAEMTKAEAYWETLASQKSSLSHANQEYHELADQTVSDADPLAQLCANIETLADLQARLSFVMREVKYLLKV